MREEHFSIGPLTDSQKKCIDGLNNGVTRKVFHRIGPVEIVRDELTLKKVWGFRERIYSAMYPKIKAFQNDPYDKFSWVLCTEDDKGEILSTARLAVDHECGLPDEKLMEKHVANRREEGCKMAELGRFIIVGKNNSLLKAYYRAFYTISYLANIDSIMMVMKRKDVSFHKRMMSVNVLEETIGPRFGSHHEYACVEWKVRDTQDSFYRWCGLRPRGRF